MFWIKQTLYLFFAFVTAISHSATKTKTKWKSGRFWRKIFMECNIPADAAMSANATWLDLWPGFCVLFRLATYCWRVIYSHQNSHSPPKSGRYYLICCILRAVEARVIMQATLRYFEEGWGSLLTSTAITLLGAVSAQGDTGSFSSTS
jgi:hypothetical protein